MKSVVKDIKALNIIIAYPFASANAICYIKINKNNPIMLDYGKYCMTIDFPISKEQYDILKGAVLNEW